MRCTACGAVNDCGRVYCGSCAHGLGRACAVCLFLNGEDVRYCGGCARDLSASVVEPEPPVQAAVVGPAAPPAATIGPRGFSVDLDDLADVRGETVPGAGAAGPSPGAADITQSDVDGFFQRLAREGVAKIPPPSPAPPPAPPTKEPS